MNAVKYRNVFFIYRYYEFLKKLVGIRYLTNVPAKADC